MKKEIDTWKLKQLFDVFKNAMLWGWYLFGAIIAAALWFFPIPQSSLQTFAFAAVFVIYTLLSVSIAKVDRIRGELE
jgi:membrane protein YdbS with pleckstrin-like domain